jgi:acylphosphatase
MTVIYKGRVQGVGFRYTTRRVAAGFEITGVVRNLPDGSVELIAEGRRDELEAFRIAVGEAGLTGFIHGERLQWENAQNEFRGFEIIS